MSFAAKLSQAARLAVDAAGNRLSGAKIIYVGEDADWVIRKEALNIQKFCARLGWSSRVAISPRGVRGKIVHFMSIHTFVRDNGEFRHPGSGNSVVVTWYHSGEEDPRLKLASKVAAAVDLVHTSCEATRELLVKHGVPFEKVFISPIAIDLEKFCPQGRRETVRDRFGIAPDRFVIGSFQKDGDGWGEGLAPKLVKGPDLFCDAIAKLHGKLPIHVLLSGPARGYVKRRLDAIGVPYTHTFLRDPDDVAELYEAIDLYLVSSRVEGGPKALMESWAMGVPLVSSRMGMVLDHARHGENAMLAEVGDAGALAAHVAGLYADPSLRARLVAQGRKDVLRLTYEVAARIYSERYAELRP